MENHPCRIIEKSHQLTRSGLRTDIAELGRRCAERGIWLVVDGIQGAGLLRADVDERDISRIKPGQNAVLMAEAYGERQFTGVVSRVSKILGKKNIRTDDPAEKNDTRILETLIDLDGPGELPVGLRLDVFIITGEGGEKTLPAYRP